MVLESGEKVLDDAERTAQQDPSPWVSLGTKYQG
jgi:hypothetical protein